MSSQYNETDDDLPLHPRSSRGEGYTSESTGSSAPEREVTLNTGVVLGIFFALVLLCAVFFGFGYSIGHKSAPVTTAGATTTEPDVTTAVESPGVAPKPTASTPQVVPEYVPATGAKPAAVPAKPLPVSPAAKDVKPAGSTSSAAPAVRPQPVPVHIQNATPAVATAAPPEAGSIYVQVAAVSHQEDADVLQNALRRRGYAVHVRNDASDHLMHVQVGPLSTRKEAEAMRQRLAGDGYNGFIK